MAAGNAPFQRAETLFDLGRWEASRAEFVAGLAHDPRNARAHAMVSLCLLNLGDSRQARDWAAKAVEVNPEHPDGFYSLSIACFRFGQIANGFEAIDTAISLRPSETVYLAFKARMVLNVKHDALGTETLARAGLRFNPRHRGCLDLLAESLLQQGRNEEASKVVEGALLIDPEFASAHIRHGWELLRRGDHRGAMDRFREGLRLDPNDAKARVGFAEAIKSQNSLYRRYVRLTMLSRSGPVRRFFALPQWVRLSLTAIVGFVAIVGLLCMIDYLRDTSRVGFDLLMLGLGASALFLALLALAKPFGNLMMAFHKVGRHLLTPAQRPSAFAFAGCIFWLAVTVPIAFVASGESWAMWLMGGGLLVISTAAVALAAPAPKRIAAWCLVGAAVTVVIVAAMAAASQSDEDLSHLLPVGTLGFLIAGKRLLKQKPRR